jgi:hypothetical protein
VRGKALGQGRYQNNNALFQPLAVPYSLVRPLFVGLTVTHQCFFVCLFFPQFCDIAKVTIIQKKI